MRPFFLVFIIFSVFILIFDAYVLSGLWLQLFTMDWSEVSVFFLFSHQIFIDFKLETDGKHSLYFVRNTWGTFEFPIHSQFPLIIKFELDSLPCSSSSYPFVNYVSDTHNHLFHPKCILSWYCVFVIIYLDLFSFQIEC